VGELAAFALPALEEQNDRTIGEFFAFRVRSFLRENLSNVVADARFIIGEFDSLRKSATLLVD